LAWDLLLTRWFSNNFKIMMANNYHLPVLSDEVMTLLDPKPSQIIVDGTLGGGGHSEMILKKIGKLGKLVAIDQDPQAIEYSKKRLENYAKQISFVNDNFINLENILKKLEMHKVDGILLDLGVSSHQIDTPERGFSFGESSLEALLDMRMNPLQELNAYQVVNLYPEKELKRIFYQYGEERFGAKIARQIVKDREINKIETCGQLVDEIRKATPPDYRFSPEHGHWARKVFQAIRMEVNQELPVLKETLPVALESLNSKGRLVVITFHSLEDKIVKHQFLDWQRNGQVEVLTLKPIVSSSRELIDNPRSKSAKLRAVVKN
jgi:16S rRNA (cytosine1402-N4)-methyltransferase